MNDLRLQAPGAEIDYPMDWSAWLQADETVIDAEFAIMPDDGVSLESEGSDDTTTTVTVSGLTFGTTYRLDHTITSNAGRTDTRSIVIRCAHT